MVGTEVGALDLADSREVPPRHPLTPDRLVLHPAQAVGIELSGREGLAGLEQRGRAEQAADMVGAERRRVTDGHGVQRYR